ncbi:MAG: hypothetical protein WC187_06465 [Bacillota bacterium]
MVEKEITIRVAPHCYKIYCALQTATDHDTRTIFEYITDGIEQLRVTPNCGKSIQKKQCAHVLKEHELTNLWVLRLNNGWRILYSLIGDGERRIAVIIVFLGDHKEYERYLKY